MADSVIVGSIRITITLTIMREKAEGKAEIENNFQTTAKPNGRRRPPGSSPQSIINHPAANHEDQGKRMRATEWKIGLRDSLVKFSCPHSPASILPRLSAIQANNWPTHKGTRLSQSRTRCQRVFLTLAA